ncbi:hypothetical protein IFO70_27775 [Phormidium tenue FACHB-886]|nr:hypothetical protein [Phormidium tenue FACHB-886]
MSVSDAIEPRFRRGDRVHFTGGNGRVRSYQFESGIWVYVVEIGTELKEELFGSTTILMSETDLSG